MALIGKEKYNVRRLLTSKNTRKLGIAILRSKGYTEREIDDWVSRIYIKKNAEKSSQRFAYTDVNEPRIVMYFNSPQGLKNFDEAINDLVTKYKGEY